MGIRLYPQFNLHKPTVIEILSGGEWACIFLINMSNAVYSNELHMTMKLGTLSHQERTGKVSTTLSEP